MGSCGLQHIISQLEKAYDKVMMEQLTKRKKGVTYGTFKVQLMILSLSTWCFLNLTCGNDMIHMVFMSWQLTS